MEPVWCRWRMLQYLVVKMFYLENEAGGYFKAFRMSVCVWGGGAGARTLDAGKKKKKNEKWTPQLG